MTWLLVWLQRPLERPRTAWWTRLLWLLDRRCAEDSHDVLWTTHGLTLVGQCTRCRVNVNVVTQRSNVDATCSTDNRPSEDFDGCTD